MGDGFLKGLLSTIGEGKTAAPISRTSSNALPSKPNETVAKKTESTNGANPDTPRLEKRKAEGSPHLPPGKVQKREIPSPANAAPKPGQKSLVKQISSVSINSIPQRPRSSQSNFVPSGQKVTAKQAGGNQLIANDKSQPTPKLAPVATPKPAPPRGSYAQMLQRAKAEQGQGQTVGSIKHKKTEIVSKKDKEKLVREAEEQAKAKAAATRDSKLVVNGTARQGQAAQGKKMELPQEKPKKKTADAGYNGTMRSTGSVSSYKGTMTQRPPQSPRKIDSKALEGSRSNMGKNGFGAASKGKIRMAGYASYSEDDLNDEDGYDSEGSSNMEAAVFEVDEEEERTLRVARKEDAEAEKEEQEHQREKQQKRKRLLAQLAAEAEKKRKRF